MGQLSAKLAFCGAWRIAAEKLLVPLAGIEPALLAELDFESSASTNSATGAFARNGPKACVAKRAEYSGRLFPVNPRTGRPGRGAGSREHAQKHCRDTDRIRARSCQHTPV